MSIIYYNLLSKIIQKNKDKQKQNKLKQNKTKQDKLFHIWRIVSYSTIELLSCWLHNTIVLDLTKLK